VPLVLSRLSGNQASPRLAHPAAVLEGVHSQSHHVVFFHLTCYVHVNLVQTSALCRGFRLISVL
jgi:hypothetical protein